MNLYIPFETVFVLTAIAYVNSAILLLAAANICLAVIEAIECGD